MIVMHCNQKSLTWLLVKFARIVWGWAQKLRIVVKQLRVMVKDIVPADVSEITHLFTRIFFSEVLKGKAVKVVNSAFPDILYNPSSS